MGEAPPYIEAVGGNAPLVQERLKTEPENTSILRFYQLLCSNYITFYYKVIKLLFIMKKVFCFRQKSRGLSQIKMSK